MCSRNRKILKECWSRRYNSWFFPFFIAIYYPFLLKYLHTRKAGDDDVNLENRSLLGCRLLILFNVLLSWHQKLGDNSLEQFWRKPDLVSSSPTESPVWKNGPIHEWQNWAGWPQSPRLFFEVERTTSNCCSGWQRQLLGQKTWCLHIDSLQKERKQIWVTLKKESNFCYNTNNL